MNNRLLLIVIAVYLFSCGPSPGNQILINEGLPGNVIDAYWLYLPRGHQNHQKWPVILFLQGGAGTSPNPRSTKEDGPAKFALLNVNADGPKHVVSDTFIIINPHMTPGPRSSRQWDQHGEELLNIVNQVITKHSGDPNRIYLTGLSKGGHGSWELYKKNPDKFAALLTISGRVECRDNCEKLAEKPIWLVHNERDDQVEFGYTEKVVAYFTNQMDQPFTQINTINRNVITEKRIFTAFPADGHDAWNNTYNSTVVYDWMLLHKTNP